MCCVVMLALLVAGSDGARVARVRSQDEPWVDYKQQARVPTNAKQMLHRLNLDNGLGIANGSTYLAFADGFIGTGLAANTIGSWAPAAGRCIASLIRMKAMLLKIAGKTVEGDEIAEVDEMIHNASFLEEKMSKKDQDTINDKAQIEVYQETLKIRTELWTKLAGILGTNGVAAKKVDFAEVSMYDQLTGPEVQYQWAYQCSGCASCSTLPSWFRSPREEDGGDCFGKSCARPNAGEPTTNMPNLFNNGSFAILSYDMKLQSTMRDVVQYFTGPGLAGLSFHEKKTRCYTKGKPSAECKRYNKIAAVISRLSRNAMRKTIAAVRSRKRAEKAGKLAAVARYASNLLASPAGTTLVAGIQLLRTIFPPQAGFSLLLTPYSACDVGHRLVDFAAAVQEQSHGCFNLNNRLAAIDTKAHEEAEAAEVSES